MEFCVLITIACFLLQTSDAASISKTKLFDEDGEYGDHFEGDMVLTAEQRAEIDEAITIRDDESVRNGLISGAKRWPNKTVVYHITEDHFDEGQIQKIKEALADIANKTCIQFCERENDEYAVVIQGSENGCYSSVGYISLDEDGDEANQVINLASGCFKHGTIVHEMLHTIGFYHMQSTYDRDEFITIAWENIKEGTKHNFAKYTNDTVTDFGVPYDYSSVMHYSKLAFSKNGKDTIIPKKENVTIGQRNSLSKSDLIKLNKMYDCPVNIATEAPVDFIDNIFESLLENLQL